MKRNSQAETDVLLECCNLEASYQNVQVLYDISLQFKKGEFIGLLGRNGAGKSTLLSCLVGTIPSSAKHLSISGLNPQRAERTDIAKKVSYVPQEHDDMFPFSVLEVVVMGRTAYLGPFGAPNEDDYTLCRQVLDELYISHLTDRIYNTLSGGEKQLVLLARAIVQTREMVFLDEPTNHLDYKNRYRILASLKAQCLQNDSCVVASLHDPNFANIFADRVILLDKGRIIGQGKTKDVMTGESISRLYGLAVHFTKRSIEPCFGHPSFAGKVLLLVGESGSGKTSMLTNIVELNNTKTLDGVLCPGTWKNDRRYSSTIVRIANKASAPFAKRQEENGDGPFIFYPEGKRNADEALVAEQHHNTDCVIIDEIGPQELQNKGYSAHLPPLLSLKDVKHIWAVRPSVVEEVCAKWMLVAPEIVDVTAPDTEKRVMQFLNS